jgi:hypothetical protein
MPFRFTRGSEPPEDDASDSYPDDLVAALVNAAPRLSKLNRRWMKSADLADMARDGWTPDEVARLVESWPNVGSVGLSLLVSLSVAVRRRVGGAVGHVVAWTHALATDEAPGRFRSRALGAEELRSARDSARTSLPDLAERYSAAAGSSDLGLAAAAAGLSITQTETRATSGSLDLGELRQLAAARGVDLP